MRALDLCAGAGGLTLGLRDAGFDVLGVENDAAAVDTHRRHAGPCELADLRTWHPPHAFDLVAGGPPCQPFSQAGLGLGLDDPRYLVPDFLRVAREAKVRAVLFENVRGLAQRARDLRAVLDLFEAEYLTAWTVLDAADYGVPQHRDRLFVVGFKDAAARAAWKWPQASHAPPRDVLGRPPYRTVREALGLGDGAYRAGPKENAKSGQLQGMRLLNVDAPGYAIGTSSFDLLDQPSPCVTATEQKSAMNGTQPMSRRRRASERPSEALGSLDRPAPVITTRVDTGRDAGRPSRRPLTELQHALGALDRPSACISAGGTEGGGGPEPFANADYRRELGSALEAAGLADRPATTVQADPRLAVAGHHDRQQKGAVRLTPAQCAALQDFPAGWTFTGNKSSQHRQIGNAVPRSLGAAVARSMWAALSR